LGCALNSFIGMEWYGDGMSNFSKYIVYVDESGDHGLKSIDPHYPVFVLAFCVFNKQTYSRDIVPSIQYLKFRFWGHDNVILRSHDIRKSRGNFKILYKPVTRTDFLEAMNSVVRDAHFTLIAAVIRKKAFLAHTKSSGPANVYSVALKFCLERLYFHLQDLGETRRVMHIVVESRGRNEDRNLELEFRRICQGENYRGHHMNFEIVFLRKSITPQGFNSPTLSLIPSGDI